MIEKKYTVIYADPPWKYKVWSSGGAADAHYPTMNAMNQVKTERTCYESAINCDKARAYEDMLATKQRWGKEYRKRKGYHIIQSFAPGEVTPDEAHAVGVEFAHRLLSKRYEVIVTTHLDKAHLHNHIVFGWQDVFRPTP